MRLRDALLGCSTGQLGRIAATWGVRPEAGALRRELVELLTGLLAERVQDDAAWQTLDGREIDVLRLVVRAEGRHEQALLVRRLARPAHGGPPSEQEVEALDAAVGRLVERGLLYRLFEADGQRRGVILVLPTELLEAVQARLGRGGGAPLPPAVPVPALVARCDPAHDLFVLASALRREVWSEASRGLAGRPARTLGQLLAALHGAVQPGPGAPGRRWRFLLWIAQRAGWIGRGAWPLPDDDVLEHILAAPIRVAAEALAAGPPEPSSMPVWDQQRGGVRLHADALELLCELEPGTWHAADAVTRWLASELAGTAEPAPAARRPAPADRVAATLGRWLAGRWFWLGLATWGGDGTTWEWVSLTDAARAAVRGHDAAPAGTARAACRPGDDLTLVAPVDADLAALYRCERYLVYAGGGVGERRYRLTPAAFERGIRLGGSADDLSSLLETLLQAPVPERWRAALGSWAGSRGQLRVAARVILSAEDEAALDGALALPPARTAVEERISGRHALVDTSRLAELLTALAEAGLAVAVDPGLRAEPAGDGRAAALAGGVAEAAWVALDVLRRLAPAAVEGQRDLQAARRTLDAALPAGTVEALERRAATIAAAIAEARAAGQRSRAGRRGNAGRRVV